MAEYLESSLSIIDSSWDIKWFIENSGVMNHYGFEKKEDGYHFKYLTSDYDKVLETINNYQTSYLEVLVPNKINQIVKLRKLKVQSYTIGGLTLELDSVAEARITGATLLAMRNPQLAEIRWDMGGGNFVAIPRDMMLAIGDGVGLYIQQCFAYSETLINQIKAAANVDACNAIDVNAGWPT
jgi:hypothetical protein